MYTCVELLTTTATAIQVDTLWVWLYLNNGKSVLNKWIWKSYLLSMTDLIVVFLFSSDIGNRIVRDGLLKQQQQQQLLMGISISQREYIGLGRAIDVFLGTFYCASNSLSFRAIQHRHQELEQKP